MNQNQAIHRLLQLDECDDTGNRFGPAGHEGADIRVSSVADTLRQGPDPDTDWAETEGAWKADRARIPKIPNDHCLAELGD